jgi:hypothetical protein
MAVSSTTPVTPIPGQPSYQVLGQSPHIQRFGVHRRSIVIKDIKIANHATLGNLNTAWGAAGVLPEGSIMQLSTDGNWYLYGASGAGAGTPALIGSTAQLCILIDPYDTAINGTGNPVVGQAYFSGCFIASFLWTANGVTWTDLGANSIVGILRANDIMVEGTTQVQPGTPYPGLGYGVSIPREDAPV